MWGWYMNSNIHEAIRDAKERFAKTKNFNRKYSLELLIRNLESYIQHFDSNFYNSIAELKQYNLQKKLLNKSLDRDFTSFMGRNKQKLCKILLPYANNPNNRTVHLDTSNIDPRTCLNIIANFLFSVDRNLYNLFIELYQNNHILIKNDYSGSGLENNEKEKESIYVFVGSLRSVSDMGTLVHEIGHAFKDYLYEDYHRYFNVEELLHSEIPSEVLELMFYNYLVNRGIYRQDAINILHNYDMSMIREARYLSISDDYNRSYLSTLTYNLGKIIAKEYTRDPSYSYLDLLRYINMHGIMKVLKGLNIDHERINDGINKEFCLIR